MNHINYFGGCPQGGIPYEIQSGDTLYGIARKFNITVSEIYAANPGVIAENLYIGQLICIPRQSQTVCPTSNYYVIQSGDTLSSVAKAFNISVNELITANPGIVPENLTVGQIICLPIAPLPVLISISLTAKRLSFYRQGKLVKSYPIAIGKLATPSPVGTYKIVNKQVNPGGPFGTRWMGLSKPGYGIHGTNNPASIGTAVSNGCIRMYNKDVNELFSQVSIGTTVIMYK